MCPTVALFRPGELLRRLEVAPGFIAVLRTPRGTWANNLVYNIHLLTGKISEPGNSPFSLTGQPSACGTAREVGAFAHRLPADLVVTNPEHRAHAEEIWKLPPGTAPDWIGSHAVKQNRDLKDGLINVYWVQVNNNNMRAAPNMMEEGLPGYRNPENFIVVSDPYPTLGGFLMGIIFWGGFNTALELTSTETFCISGHEMRDNVFEELKPTIHYTNRSGVRATCPECHVPHDWTHKIARKMQASKEVWGKIFGAINTREKFLAMRHELASREWARLEANDSLECRNCHSDESMGITRQSSRAADARERFLFTDEKTCIDCHKGIAHALPDMARTAGNMDNRLHAELTNHLSAIKVEGLGRAIMADGP